MWIKEQGLVRWSVQCFEFISGDDIAALVDNGGTIVLVAIFGLLRPCHRTLLTTGLAPSGILIVQLLQERWQCRVVGQAFDLGLI